MMLKKGCKGSDVKALQKALNLVEDGIFGTCTEEAVKAFQSTHTDSNGKQLKVDGVVGDVTWKAIMMSGIVVETPSSLKQGDKIPTMPNGSFMLIKTKRFVNNIILHCTATREGQDWTVSQIKKMHLQNGWSDIGYHYVIYRDGSIHIGRHVDKVGTHCAGHNTGSIGVVYVGGVKSDGKTPYDTRTIEQRTALKNLVVQLMKMYGLKSSQVHGHYEYANKACPSFKVDQLRREL